MRQLSQSLAANLAVLDKMFGTSADYYAKEITIYHCRGSILLFDGMASLDSLWELLLDAASRQAPPQQAGQRCTGPQVFELILHGSAFPAESEPVTDLADLIKRMTAGMAVLLLDGCAKGIAFSVQGLKFRSVDEPSGEGNLRGSREGFADLLRVNLSLLRRLIRTEHLVQEVAGRYRNANGIRHLLLQKQGRLRHGDPCAQSACRCKAGAFAGFQLLCAVAAAGQGAAVHAGKLHRAACRGGGKDL